MKYRLLSFCMAVLLLISMISVPRIEAANSTETFKDSADTKIVKLLEALGLMEIDSETGFFWDEMPVKRSELAKIICKMFNISETKDASPHFTDVSDYDRAYIETAIRNGYMSGYDNEKFGPDDYVTNIQLIKTFVTALGGDAAAQSQGGYPGGYITIGNMLGLLKGKAVANENISRRIDVANIIYTALHADVLEIAGSVGNNINYKTVEGYTFLTEKRNIYRVKGIISQNEATSLNRDNGLGEGNVKIGTEIHCDDKHLTDDYLGCNVECYVEIPKGDSAGKILYVQETSKNKMITVTDEDIIDVDEIKVRYYDQNNRKRNINMDVTYDMIYNGKAVDHISGEKLERLPYLDMADIKFIDNDDDNVYEVVVVTEYITRVAYSVNEEEEKISFQFDEKQLKLSDSFYRIYNDSGETKLSDISKGDVLLIAISENEDDEKVIQCRINSKSIQGAVKSIHNDSNENKCRVIIGEKEYITSSYCKNLESKNKIPKIEAGISGVFYLDSRGNIAYLDSRSGGEQVAFLIDSSIYTEDDGSDAIWIKLFDEQRKFKKFEVKDSIRINSKKIKIQNISNEIKEKLNMQGLIKYSEVDGELKELILPEQGYDAQKFSLDDERTMLCTHDKVLDDRYFVEPDAKIFYIPNISKEDDSYKQIMNNNGLLWVLQSDFVSNKNNYEVSLYDVAENGGVKYILIRYAYSTGGNLIGAGHEMIAVNEVDMFYDEEEGEENYQIQGWNERGELKSIKLSEASTINAKIAIVDEEKGIKNYDLQSLRKVRPGDIVQVHWDSKGRCDDMWIQHSLEDTDYYSPVLIDFDTANSSQRCIYGQSVFVSESNVIVSGKPDEYSGPTSKGCKYIGNTSEAIYKWTGRQYEKINFNDIERGNSVFAAVGANNNTRILVVYE